MVPPANLIDRLRAALGPEFRVDDYIDAGGQGAVFRGQYQGQDVAIKLFGPNQDQRRLEREIELLTRIDHPNLVKIRTFTAVDLGAVFCPVVAYEFLKGGDLRAHLSPQAQTIAEERVLKIGADVASAVEALWQQRIVHRDIKPANIVAAGQDRYVLVDLGLARHLDRSNLTLLGQTVGTQGYMSPEQARGRRSLTIHSDVFSLGVTLHELASRQHPFQRNQALIGFTTPRSLGSLRPDLQTALSELVDQMMAVIPAQRPAGLASRFSQLLGA